MLRLARVAVSPVWLVPLCLTLACPGNPAPPNDDAATDATDHTAPEAATSDAGADVTVAVDAASDTTADTGGPADAVADATSDSTAEAADAAADAPAAPIADAASDSSSSDDAAPPTACFNASNAPASGVSVGAIRYDAWFAEPESPPVENILIAGADEFFQRVPFFVTLDQGQWIVVNDTQPTVDQEIDYAFSRGIDFWAFDYSRYLTIDWNTGTIPPLDQLNGVYMRDNYRSGDVLELYLGSAHCNKPRFALIVTLDNLDNYVNLWRTENSSITQAQAWAIVIADWVKYLTRPEAQTTPDGRPLLFLDASGGESWGTVWGGDDALATQSLQQLRQAVVAAGGQPPYVVSMDVPDNSLHAIQTWGYDGASQYGWAASLNADGGAGTEQPFSQADFGTEWTYDTLMTDGLDVIPFPTSGWDFRPARAFTPAGLTSPYPPNANWYPYATPAEVVNELDQAIQFVKANPAHATPNAVVMYAWNELMEGGFLVPTLQDGSSRLDAIGAYLNKPDAGPPPLVGVVLPEVTSFGTGCSDGYGIWLVGQSFDADSYVQLRQAAVGDETVVATYTSLTRTPTAQGQPALSFCLTGSAERTLFGTTGVRVSVVNPDRPSTSTPVVVALSDQ